MSAPKHRKDMDPVTEPRVQPVPRHAGEYAIEDRTHERLGADAFEDLEREMLARRSTPLGALVWESLVAPHIGALR